MTDFEKAEEEEEEEEDQEEKIRVEVGLFCAFFYIGESLSSRLDVYIFLNWIFHLFFFSL